MAMDYSWIEPASFVVAAGAFAISAIGLRNAFREQVDLQRIALREQLKIELYERIVQQMGDFRDKASAFMTEVASASAHVAMEGDHSGIGTKLVAKQGALLDSWRDLSTTLKAYKTLIGIDDPETIFNSTSFGFAFMMYWGAVSTYLYGTSKTADEGTAKELQHQSADILRPVVDAMNTVDTIRGVLEKQLLSFIVGESPLTN